MSRFWTRSTHAINVKMIDTGPEISNVECLSEGARCTQFASIHQSLSPSPNLSFLALQSLVLEQKVLLTRKHLQCTRNISLKWFCTDTTVMSLSIRFDIKSLEGQSSQIRFQWTSKLGLSRGPTHGSCWQTVWVVMRNDVGDWEEERMIWMTRRHVYRDGESIEQHSALLLKIFLKESDTSLQERRNDDGLSQSQCFMWCWRHFHRRSSSRRCSDARWQHCRRSVALLLSCCCCCK